MGLFPRELHEVRQVIEGKGLWKYYEELFEEHGRGPIYNKACVKVCVYASFFGGGDKAYNEAIMNLCRTNLGLIPEEFRNSDYYHPIKVFSNELGTFIKDTKVINTLKGVASKFFLVNKDSLVRGPTGQPYVVTQADKRTAYPNLLMSYEFYFLAFATLEALHLVSDAHLLNHFHDGNVILVKKSQVNEYIDVLRGSLSRLTKKYQLEYPIDAEYKSYSP